MQHPQDFTTGFQVVRYANPLAQSSAQLGHQLNGFFFKNRKEVFIQMVDCINVVVIVRLGNAERCGDY